MRTRRFALMACTAAAALVLAACGDGDDDTTTAPEEAEPHFAEGTTMAELADAGSITVGTKFDQPLFGLVGPDGVPVGFDVEIAKIIASELGIDEDGIEWVETISANREPFIEDGQVDIVAATYTINDERKQVVDFAGPYYQAGQMIMVLESNTDINGPDDLAGKTVCSAEGSTPAERIRTEYPEATLVPTGAYSECLEPLRNGQVDAVTTDNVILAGFVDQNPGRVQAGRRAVQRGAVRHRPEEGRRRLPQLHQRRPRGVLRGRPLGRGLGSHGRRGARDPRAADGRPVLTEQD